jgi:hypothetical protein
VSHAHKASVIDAEPDHGGPAIENELPTYRAISVLAIFSVVCGVLAVCSFADSIFYVFSVLAVGLGIWAHRTIRRYPDILTGHGLANAGIALGLVFGLASGTIGAVQYLVRSRQAERFARQFAEVLPSSNLGDVLMLMTYPDTRKNKTSADLLQDHIATQSTERKRMEMNMGPMGQFLALRRRLAASTKETVRFVKVETVVEEGGHGPELHVIAPALLEVSGPGNKEFTEKEQYALAILKGRPKGRTYEWWVEAVNFPYKPKTYVPPEKAAGDGHDHGGH